MENTLENRLLFLNHIHLTGHLLISSLTLCDRLNQLLQPADLNFNVSKNYRKDSDALIEALSSILGMLFSITDPSFYVQ